MAKQSPVAKTIHYEGLTSTVTAHDVREYRQGLSRAARVAPIIILVASLVVFGGAGISALSSNAVVGVILFIVGGLIGWGMTRVFFLSDARMVRLGRFATDNGWKFDRQPAGLPHQGVIFQIGRARQRVGVISVDATDTTMGFELGEYRYTVGSGKNQRTEWWTYCCIDLDRHVPHMLLDSRRNNMRIFGKDVASNLPSTFSKSQVVRLEGNFNEYFTLYAPKEYERDAYYIFTPDLMALLIDNSHNYDAEVIDNKLYFYVQSAGRQHYLTHPQLMYKWLTIIHTVGTKVGRQTDYYADEKVADRSADVVATQGRRLRHGVGWFAIIAVILFFVINIIVEIVWN